MCFSSCTLCLLPMPPSLLLLKPPHWSSKTRLEKALTLPFGKENKQLKNKNTA